MANSEMKLSRKKYSNEIAIIDIRRRNNIQSFYLFKCDVFLKFYGFFAIWMNNIIA